MFSARFTVTPVSDEIPSLERCFNKEKTRYRRENSAEMRLIRHLEDTEDLERVIPPLRNSARSDSDGDKFSVTLL